jgi:branched-chain amino acid transport system permease protein
LGGAIAAGLFSVIVPEVMRRVGVPGEFGDVLFSLGAIQALAYGLSIEERRLRELEAARVAALGEPVIVPLTAVTPADRLEIRPPTTNAIPALEVQNLSVNYGAVAALAGVSFSVPQGSVTALIGPNGAGKSTLIDAVTGFVAKPSGQVKLEGQALEGLAPHQRVRLGVRRSFQQDRCIADLRVRDYLRLAAGRELNAPEAQSALDFCGVTRDDVFIYGLDVGTRRLLEVAAALCARPKVVLLDEPAAGLSASESAVLSRRIAEIPARYGCAVLLVEHDMDVVRAACSQAVVLDFGQVIAQGECQSVLADPRVARAYLGEGVEAKSA